MAMVQGSRLQLTVSLEAEQANPVGLVLVLQLSVSQQECLLPTVALAPSAQGSPWEHWEGLCLAVVGTSAPLSPLHQNLAPVELPGNPWKGRVQRNVEPTPCPHFNGPNANAQRIQENKIQFEIQFLNLGKNYKLSSNSNPEFVSTGRFGFLSWFRNEHKEE